MPPKRLLVFCDGTAQDGMIASNVPTQSEGTPNVIINTAFENAVTQTMIVNAGGPSVSSVTNVLKLSRAVLPYSEDGQMRQIVFYQSGVGAEANFDGDFVPQASVLQALGVVVASKIRDAYGFIAQNFHEGDEIFLFGFSRGAYTARKLAGLIDKIGLLETQQLGHFFAIWKDLVDGKEPTIPPGTRRTNIRCVGVWDTVGAVFNVIDALHIKDTSLSPSIDYAFHAVSLQENRDRFQPTLWTLPQFGLRNGQVFKEIWFPGAHTNVGGSYDRHELSDIALFWMVGEILDASLFNLDADFIARTKQSGPDAWGTSQPRNAYNELTWGSGKLFMKAKTRLATNDITRDITFHHSWANAPDALKDPYQMITPKILKETLGAGWMPKYADLNKYEREQKDHWRSGGWQGGPGIVFDDPLQIFSSPQPIWKAPKTQE